MEEMKGDMNNANSKWIEKCVLVKYAFDCQRKSTPKKSDIKYILAVKKSTTRFEEFLISIRW